MFSRNLRIINFSLKFMNLGQCNGRPLGEGGQIRTSSTIIFLIFDSLSLSFCFFPRWCILVKRKYDVRDNLVMCNHKCCPLPLGVFPSRQMGSLHFPPDPWKPPLWNLWFINFQNFLNSSRRCLIVSRRWDCEVKVTTPSTHCGIEISCKYYKRITHHSHSKLWQGYKVEGKIWTWGSACLGTPRVCCICCPWAVIFKK